MLSEQAARPVLEVSSRTDTFNGQGEGTDMKHLITRFVREDEGQDLVEYALLIAFIALACIIGRTFGGSKYQVYGPTAAFIPVIAGLMAKYGEPAA